MFSSNKPWTNNKRQLLPTLWPQVKEYSNPLFLALEDFLLLCTLEQKSLAVSTGQLRFKPLGNTELEIVYYTMSFHFFYCQRHYFQVCLQYYQNYIITIWITEISVAMHTKEQMITETKGGETFWNVLD